MPLGCWRTGCGRTRWCWDCIGELAPSRIGRGPAVTPGRRGEGAGRYGAPPRPLSRSSPRSIAPTLPDITVLTVTGRSLTVPGGHDSGHDICHGRIGTRVTCLRLPALLP